MTSTVRATLDRAENGQVPADHAAEIRAAAKRVPQKVIQKNPAEVWGLLRSCVCVRGECCPVAGGIVLAVGASSQVPIDTVPGR